MVRAVEIALVQNNAPLGEVVITLGMSQLLLELNKQFRKIDSTTDVLTFPSPERFSQCLGDVIINWEMAESQARMRSIRPIDEAAMLAVHGVLHLLGFDDHNEKDRKKMILAMNQAIAVAGLPTDENWSSIPHEEPIYNG